MLFYESSDVEFCKGKPNMPQSIYDKHKKCVYWKARWKTKTDSTHSINFFLMIPKNVYYGQSAWKHIYHLSSSVNHSMLCS